VSALELKVEMIKHGFPKSDPALFRLVNDLAKISEKCMTEEEFMRLFTAADLVKADKAPSIEE
jgi:hypothetical protein